MQSDCRLVDEAIFSLLFSNLDGLFGQLRLPSQTDYQNKYHIAINFKLKKDFFRPFVCLWILNLFEFRCVIFFIFAHKTKCKKEMSILYASIPKHTLEDKRWKETLAIQCRNYWVIEIRRERDTQEKKKDK